MSGILSLEQLKEKSQETQKALMEDWIIKYTVKEIREQLGLNQHGYYKYINELGIGKQAPRAARKEPVSDEEFSRMKDNIISFETLMNLPTYQRYKLMPYYLKDFEAVGLAEVWGVDVSRIYNLTYQMKKFQDKEEKKKPKKPKKTKEPKVNNEVETQEEPLVIKLTEEEKKEIESGLFPAIAATTEPVKTDSESEAEAVYISISQKGSASDIKRKMDSLSALLEEGEKYNFSITIQK